MPPVGANETLEEGGRGADSRGVCSQGRSPRRGSQGAGEGTMRGSRLPQDGDRMLKKAGELER